MKKLSLILMGAAVLLCMNSCSSKYETVKGDALGTKIYTLDNGLKVYMSVNKETPRIQTYIAVRAGGKNGPDESTGLAHYFEHLMFKGTQQFGTSDYAAEEPLLNQIEQLFEVYRQTTDEAERTAIYHKIDSISYEASKISIPNEYDKLMAVIGADGTNAWTSMDETVYTEDIPSNQIENWAKIQSDRFKNVVLRGFHTELETIYEEKNMSLTQDSRKLFEAIDASLFPHHPYGNRTVLGTQEHLKNPSITNVKKFHDDYYVPNNVAICLSGDFDPDEMIAVIKKYFGDWQPNPSVPVLKYETEAPITSPVVTDVYGLESEYMAMAWRLEGATNLKDAAVANIAGSILSNGQAGLMDLDLNQQQRVLAAAAGCNMMPDYGEFISYGYPKEGQTLEEVRDLILEEVAKLRSGDFDESLLKAIVNNFKLSEMRSLTQNSARAQKYVTAFINGVDWKDAATEIERYEAVTKADVVAWANKYLGAESYVITYKRQGVDNTVQKVSAPAITPIVTNRDKQSDFLTEVQNTAVKPIEPVYVDFSKDMAQYEIVPGLNVLYKQNKLNDIFDLSFTFNKGIADDPALSLAVDYISYLGTPSMSAVEIAQRMYELACSFSFASGNTQSSLSLSGLSENMEESIRLVEDLVYNAQPDDEILTNLKYDVLRSRMIEKTNQRSCYSALVNYMTQGPEMIQKTTLGNEALFAVTSEELLGKIRELFGMAHEILYYGPMAENESKQALAESHQHAGSYEPVAERYTPSLQTPSSRVLMCQYDSKQIYYQQYSNRGEKFDLSASPVISLYNEYFGGSMNSIVFQEMREARGLAYSASAYLSTPSTPESSYSFSAFIATQNDKMQQAVEAFDDIINNMPESDKAFAVGKDAILSRIRTSRTTGIAVLNRYVRCRRMGLSEPEDKAVFEAIQNMTLADVKAAQEKWVKGRVYNYAILGDIKDLDVNYLRTLGPVQVVSLEEVFGY